MQQVYLFLHACVLEIVTSTKKKKKYIIQHLPQQICEMESKAVQTQWNAVPQSINCVFQGCGKRMRVEMQVQLKYIGHT